MTNRYTNPHAPSWETARIPFNSTHETVDDYFARQGAITGSWVTGEASALMANYGSQYELPDGRQVEISVEYGRRNRRYDLGGSIVLGRTVIRSPYNALDATTSIKIFQYSDDGKHREAVYAYDSFEYEGDSLAIAVRQERLIRGRWQLDQVPPAAVGITGEAVNAFFEDITPPIDNSMVVQNLPAVSH